MPPNHGSTCPICGMQLVELQDDDPDTAPYLCANDSRGWWPSELVPAARKHFNANRRDFGLESEKVTRNARKERDDARKAKKERGDV